MKCPKCGKEIANDIVYCEYCGEKVVPVAAKKKLPLWLIIVGALIVVALIVIFCYDSSPESQPLPDEEALVQEVTDSTSGASIVHSQDSLNAAASQPAESKQVAEDNAAKQAKIEADKKAKTEAEKKAQEDAAKKAAAKKAKKEPSAREQAQPADEPEDGVEDVIFKVVEEMPSFPGGEEAFRNYLSNNLRYPVEAQENGLQGRTICQFVVDTDGSIRDVQVVRSSGTDALDKEAVRVLRAMPRWRPGSQRGRKVRVLYTAPINFRMQ